MRYFFSATFNNNYSSRSALQYDGSWRQPEYQVMRTFQFSIATIMLLVITSSAHAFSVTWAFQDTLFDDGSSLTGTFDFDADIGAPGGYSNLNLQTSAGRLSATSYTSDVLGFSTDFRFFSATGMQVLVVTLADSMTNAGGVIDIASGWLSVEAHLKNWGVRAIATGSIVGATGLPAPSDTLPVALTEPPLPLPIIILVTGLAVVIALRRRATI